VDDSVGHLSDDRPGTLLGSRYEIVKQCGLGTFGKVFTCEDRKTKCRVAVKVIRGIKRYAESAEIEAAIIRKVNNRDKENKSMNVKLLDLFKQKSTFESDHVCLVFEQLDVSIYDFMKKNRYRGFLHESIREIARQMLHAVSFLHDMNLTHTDLKPENVLLVDASYDVRHDVTKPRDPYVS
jgi:serine/threonine protein kinase